MIFVPRMTSECGAAIRCVFSRSFKNTDDDRRPARSLDLILSPAPHSPNAGNQRCHALPSACEVVGRTDNFPAAMVNQQACNHQIQNRADTDIVPR